MDYNKLIKLSNSSPDNTIMINLETLKLLGHIKHEKVMILDIQEYEGRYVFPTYSRYDKTITINCEIDSKCDGICNIFTDYYTTKILSFRVLKGIHKYPLVMMALFTIRFYVNTKITSFLVEYVDLDQDAQLSSERYNKYLLNATLFNLYHLNNIIIRIKPNDFLPEIVHHYYHSYHCDDIGTELTKRNEIIERLSCFALRISNVMTNSVITDIWTTIYKYFYMLV